MWAFPKRMGHSFDDNSLTKTARTLQGGVVFWDHLGPSPVLWRHWDRLGLSESTWAQWMMMVSRGLVQK